MSTGSLESRLFGARDRILLDLMDPLLQGYNIFVYTFDEWYLLNEQWIAPVDLGNDLMNHHARLVDLAIEPSLLCPQDGISAVELLQHVVTNCAKIAKVCSAYSRKSWMKVDDLDVGFRHWIEEGGCQY